LVGPRWRDDSRLGKLNDEQLVYRLRKPTVDDRTELLLTPPRLQYHRCCGVLAANAKQRRVVTESAGPSGASDSGSSGGILSPVSLSRLLGSF